MTVRRVPDRFRKIAQTQQNRYVCRDAIVASFGDKLYTVLSVEERNFLLENIIPPMRARASFGYLPYLSDIEKEYSDSIIKKLGLRKFFIGPRANSRAYQPAQTPKANAVAVSLYCKTEDQKEKLWLINQKYTVTK